MRKILSLTLSALVGVSAFAGGYRVAIQGQRQLAMGHTGVAVINSAEVAFFNPAGMVYLDKKFNLSVGANALFSKTRFQNSQYNWEASTDNFGTPFSIYATYQLTDWLTAGLAVYSPYGSSVEWDKGWEGAHLVNNIDLKAIFVQPSLAVKLSDQFSLGGGLIYATGGVEFNRNLQYPGGVLQNSNVTLDASGISAWGYNIGMMVTPTEKVRLGLNYRSKIVMEARDGDASYSDVPDYAASLLQDTKFDADLPLPAELTTGLSVQITDKWLVAFDYNYTMWSAYKALDISFANGSSSSNKFSIL